VSSEALDVLARALAAAAAAARARQALAAVSGTPEAEAAARTRAAASAALRTAMDAGDWSVSGLARALGVDHGLVSRWRTRQRPPPWLALAMQALDAGDAAEQLDAAGLRERLRQGEWTAAGLAQALGVERDAVARWAGSVRQPPRGVGLAINEAERRIPPAARFVVHMPLQLEVLDSALVDAHEADRELRAERAGASLTRSFVDGSRWIYVAKTLSDAMDHSGWSVGRLATSLGTGHDVVSRWRRAERLPPPWLALAMLAREGGDVAEDMDAAGLRDRMKREGWSVAGLAAALGVGRHAVTRWRSDARGQGRRPVPPPGVSLAINEAERRVPRWARRSAEESGRMARVTRRGMFG